MAKSRKRAALRNKQDHGRNGRGLPLEEGAVVKDWGGRLSVALTFPNSYYVGMSSLAFQLLYSWLNDEPDVVCERIFWKKGAAATGERLLSLENGRPADDFDIWAFTISWEMDYFNVVEMLRQAGIPPLAAERDKGTRWGRLGMAADHRRRSGNHDEPGADGPLFRRRSNRRRRRGSAGVPGAVS